MGGSEDDALPRGNAEDAHVQKTADGHTEQKEQYVNGHHQQVHACKVLSDYYLIIPSSVVYTGGDNGSSFGTKVNAVNNVSSLGFV